MSFFDSDTTASAIGRQSYSLRISKRAKRIILKINHAGALEVVLPSQKYAHLVPDLVKKHQEWIEQRQHKVALRKEQQYKNSANLLIKGGSERLVLCDANGRPIEQNSFKISTTHLRATQEEHTRLLCIPQEFLVYPAGTSAIQGCFGNEGTEKITHANPVEADSPWQLTFGGQAWLRGWVLAEARSWLEDLLELIANTYQFKYMELRVRLQRTRWGSCSARGNINLNAALLFLPLELVRYIILHELCHTRQMNHSEAFWRELFAVDPDALRHDKAMRHAKKYLPWWLN